MIQLLDIPVLNSHPFKKKKNYMNVKGFTGSCKLIRRQTTL